MEIEAKFKLEDPAALQFWKYCFEHEQNFGGWVRSGKNEGVKRMRSFYFDTADEDLARQRAGLRLRQENETWILTLKQTLRQDQALSERHEWECFWSGEIPEDVLCQETSLKAAQSEGLLESVHHHLGSASAQDGAKLEPAFHEPQTKSLSASGQRHLQLSFTEEVLCSMAEISKSDEALRQLCERVEGKELQLVAAVTFERQLTLLEKDLAKVEWALDRGAFLNSRGEQRPFAEMEAEIKAGNEADLADLLEIFRQKYPLEAERRSKLERALAFQRESQAH